MIATFKERASVKKGGFLEIRCPDLPPDTIVDVIVLITSSPNDKERENYETMNYPVSDFLLLLKDGPKISLEKKEITREWIHRKDNENDLYR